MLKADLCDFSDAYIVVEETKENKSVAFKNNAPFINCILKINAVKVDNEEDLDVLMSMAVYKKKQQRKQKHNRQFVELSQR